MLLECAKKNMEYNDSFIGLFSISLTNIFITFIAVVSHQYLEN